MDKKQKSEVNGRAEELDEVAKRKTDSKLETANTESRSGGIDVKANEVIADGDIVGRDKIEVKHYHAPQMSSDYMDWLHRSQRTGSAIGGIVMLLLIGAIVIAILYNTGGLDAALKELGVSRGFAEVVLKFGGKGSGPGLIDGMSCCIAVDPDGNIYVADHETGRVQKFDPNGKFIWLTILQPNEYGNNYIMDIATDFSNHMYVVMFGDIVELSPENGVVLDTFRHPVDSYYDRVDVSPSNTLYVLSGGISSSSSVIKLSPDGATLGQWNDVFRNISKGGMLSDIAVDGNDNIYISGSLGNPQVYKFNKDGEFTDRFGNEGDAPGSMYSPNAIAVDGRTHVYIIDVSGGCCVVNVYDAGGNYIDRIEARDPVSEGPFRDLAIDVKGNIYAITYYGIILKFKLTGE